MFYWVEKAHGLRYVYLRFFNACGAHISGKIGEAHNTETKLIPIILQAAQCTRDNISVLINPHLTEHVFVILSMSLTLHRLIFLQLNIL